MSFIKGDTILMSFIRLIVFFGIDILLQKKNNYINVFD